MTLTTMQVRNSLRGLTERGAVKARRRADRFMVFAVEGKD